MFSLHVFHFFSVGFLGFYNWKSGIFLVWFFDCDTCKQGSYLSLVILDLLMNVGKKSSTCFNKELFFKWDLDLFLTKLSGIDRDGFFLTRFFKQMVSHPTSVVMLISVHLEELISIFFIIELDFLFSIFLIHRFLSELIIF